MSKLRRVCAAATVVGALVLAACGSDEDGAESTDPTVSDESADTGAADTDPPATQPPSSESPTTTAPAGAPATSAAPDETEIDPEGALRIGVAAPSDSLDPHLTTGATSGMYQNQIYDRLFFIDQAGSAAPMLAEDYEFSADGSSLEIGLRDDVVFHDGTPVDAAAVKASLDRGRTLEGSTVANVLSVITGVEVIDQFTVRLNLDGAGPELPAVLATNAGMILNPVVLDDPSVDLGTAPPAAAGSGPYVVTASEPNVETSYAQAPEYWNVGAGRLAELTLTFVQQSPTRLAGIQAGDFDMVIILGTVLEETRDLADSGAFDLFETKAGGSGQDLMFNVESGDLADLDVRRAIAMAINREELGLVFPCVEHTQTQQTSNWAYNPDIENLTYDPETARQIVDDHGGVTLEVLVAAGTSFETTATAVQGQLAEVGIEMTIVPQEFGTVQQRLASGDFQSVLQQMDQQGDPIGTLNRFFVGGYRLVRGEFADALTTVIQSGADTSLTQAERAPIYQEAFQMIADEQVFVPICRGLYGYAYTAPIVGFDQMDRVGLQDYTYLAVAKQ